jgi:hypothetical protein
MELQLIGRRFDHPRGGHAVRECFHCIHAADLLFAAAGMRQALRDHVAAA